MDEVNSTEQIPSQPPTQPDVQPVSQPIAQPEMQPTDQQSADNTPMPSTPSGGSNKMLLLIAVVVLVVLLAAGGFYYMNMNKNKISNGSSSSANPFQTVTQQSPYDALQAALTKTVSANTAYLEYKMDVTSHISEASNGVTQTVHDSVDGNLSGSTDGKTTDLEMNIFNDATPNTSVDVSVITTPDGSIYTKTAKTAPKWQKETKAQQDQVDNSPTDASLFGLNILGDVFSTDHPLFNSFSKDSVTSLGDVSENNTTYTKYQVEVSNPLYIAALAKDKNATPKMVSDTKQILQDAIITVTYYVDKNTGYIGKFHLDGKKFTQIPTPQSQQLGLSAVHDISLDATLSRFNVPTNITPPATTDVLGISTGPVKPSLPLKPL